MKSLFRKAAVATASAIALASPTIGQAKDTVNVAFSFAMGNPQSGRKSR